MEYQMAMLVNACLPSSGTFSLRSSSPFLLCSSLLLLLLFSPLFLLLFRFFCMPLSLSFFKYCFLHSTFAFFLHSSIFVYLWILTHPICWNRYSPCLSLLVLGHSLSFERDGKFFGIKLPPFQSLHTLSSQRSLKLLMKLKWPWSFLLLFLCTAFLWGHCFTCPLQEHRLS